MDVPGTILFALAICALLVLWLREDERAPVSLDAQPYAGSGRWTDDVIAAALAGEPEGSLAEGTTHTRREGRLVQAVAASPGSREP